MLPSMEEISKVQKQILRDKFRDIMSDAINTFGHVPLSYSRRLWQWARKEAYLIETGNKRKEQV